MTTLCRVCLKPFDPSENSAEACKYHPESFSGETSQRWNPPGVTGGGEVQYFWTCCGSHDKTSIGCVQGRHKSYDEPDTGAPIGKR